MRTRKNCYHKGCKRQQEKFSIFCENHSKPTPASKPKPQEVLTALCAAVAAKYKNEGDRTKAGVVIAELQHSPSRFYASVAHYPNGPMNKVVALQVGRSVTESFTTAEEAVVALAQKFADDNRPAPVKETLETLDEVLK